MVESATSASVKLYWPFNGAIRRLMVLEGQVALRNCNSIKINMLAVIY